LDRSVLFVSKNRQLITKVKNSLKQFKNIDYSHNYTLESVLNNHEVIIYPSLPFLKNVCNIKNELTEIIIFGKQSLLKYCFQKGCHDYLKIPWDHEELLFRISRNKHKNIYYKKDHTISLGADQILFINGFQVNLTYQEYLIIKILFKFPNSPISKDILYQAINFKDEINSRVVEVHISNIRKKSKNTIFHIINIRNIGYMIKIVE